MKKIKLIIFIAIIGFQLNAQGRFDNVEIKVSEVKENLYMLEGAGGNIAVLSGSDGNIMIDAQFADLSKKILSAISDHISEAPVKYLINTHYHGDHTGGNENLHNAGAIIIAHEKVRTRLSTDQNMAAFNKVVKAKPEAFWPDITYNTGMNIYLNDQNLQLIHFDNAHTDGDSFVFFTDLNVLHMGDTFFNKRFPYIDLGSGGSVKGYINAVKGAIMIVDEDTMIIPGHGELATKNDLKDFLYTIEEMVFKVQSAIADGKTYEEIAEMQLYEDFQSWGTGFISGDRMVNTIWTDLNRE